MIRKLCAIAAAAALLVAAPLTASAAPAAPSTSVSTHYSAHYKPSHKDNYSKLAAKWWQWAVAKPVPKNPTADPNGSLCATGQRGKAWFLAGSFSGGDIKRSCTLPAGKDLFFPLINQAYLRAPGEEVTLREQRQALADLDVKNQATNLRVWFDGKDITKKVVKFEKSVVFGATLPADNVLGGAAAGSPAGRYFPSVDNGYYALIKDVRPGKHTLHFTGKYGDFELDVKYRQKVTR